jgi:hypothetical protein
MCASCGAYIIRTFLLFALVLANSVSMTEFNKRRFRKDRRLQKGDVSLWGIRMPVRERRVSSRIDVSFPARLRGVDARGRTFREDTALDNLSVGGAHLRLKRSVQQGSEVTVAARLSTLTDPRIPALRLVARGTVLRAEPEPGGTWGVAVEFRRRRIL